MTKRSSYMRAALGGIAFALMTSVAGAQPQAGQPTPPPATANATKAAPATPPAAPTSALKAAASAPSATPSTASAPATTTPPSKATLREAKRLYIEGINLYQGNQWSDALDSLRESARIYPLPLTLLNIALCERSLGHYVRARQAFRQADALVKDSPKSLTNAETRELREYLRENENIVAYADLTVAPATTRIAIDGRPLEATTDDAGQPLYLAGTTKMGSAVTAPATSFVVRIDPGAHVVELSCDGFRTYTKTEVFQPGKRRPLEVRLDRLPATLTVSADQSDAVATISGGNLGTVVRAIPLLVEGSPGQYSVDVEKKGYVRYHDNLELKPGDKPELFARLAVYKPPIYKRWWFWTAGVAVVGAAVGLGVGLSLKPPPYQSGSSGWVATTKALQITLGAR